MPGKLKKQLGQHFLVDEGFLHRIVRAIDPKQGQQLVEIGPGGGALTLPLLDATGQLTAIELDRDLHQPLLERSARHGQLTLIKNDVLKVNFASLAAETGDKLRLVGNLPYYLSSPILFHCISFADCIVDMSFLLQKEVVQRVVAQPGSKTYGRLSVMVQLTCRGESMLDVPPEAFRPPPNVDSALLRLVPLPAAERTDIDHPVLVQVVREAFGKRRKTLGNALKGTLSREQIEAAGIDPGLRAETLPPSAFVTLARQVTVHVD